VSHKPAGKDKKFMAGSSISGSITGRIDPADTGTIPRTSKTGAARQNLEAGIT
jgi:hypothetical protein